MQPLDALARNVRPGPLQGLGRGLMRHMASTAKYYCTYCPVAEDRGGDKGGKVW